MKIVRVALAVLFALPCMAQEAKPAAPGPGVVSTAEMQRLMPPSVFFQGQSATTQLRNSFGVRFANGGLMLAGIVDTGGYSTAIRNKYQFYLLTDTGIDLGGIRLAPGAYGCGFLADGMVVMDLGGVDLFHKPVTHDAAMTRPRPLQIVAGKSPGEYRLYLGRDYVTIRQANLH